MKNLKEIMRMMRQFIELYPRITVQQALLLLVISENDGEEQKVLVKKAEMNTTTASKHIRMFSDQLDSYKKPGMGFISVRPMPMNLTSNTIHLTEKGKQFLEDL